MLGTGVINLQIYADESDFFLLLRRLASLMCSVNFMMGLLMLMCLVPMAWLSFDDPASLIFFWSVAHVIKI